MPKYTKEQIEEAKEGLRKMLKPGDEIYTILRHCSRSGMSRSISLLRSSVNEKGEAETSDISYWAARAMEDQIDQKNGGIKIGGCGMDMGFALVYNLGRRLWPGGFDTIPYYGVTDKGTPKYWRNTPMERETDGGYALKQRWL